VHEEGVEPTHLAVPEPKGHIDEHDGAGSGNRAGHDVGDDANVHEGPGVGGGWAAGQGVDQSTGIAPTREGSEDELDADTTGAWAGTVRTLNEAVLAALERRDIYEARAAARALAEVLAGVASQDA
jgi:hypothetical protein